MDLEQELETINYKNNYITISIISLVLFIAINWYYYRKPSKYRRVTNNQENNTFLERHRVSHVNSIVDMFSAPAQIGDELIEFGISDCNLIYGIDFTVSNSLQGIRTFDGRNLHSTNYEGENPYESVIRTLGEALQSLNNNEVVYAYGFGDMSTKDIDVFPLSPNGFCVDYKQVLMNYRSTVARVKLSGPTNYAPVINRAAEITRQSNKYSILVIIVDGMPTDTYPTEEAVNRSADVPLFIIIVGVGDGPWDNMNRFIATFKKRNIKFMDYNRIQSFASANEDAALALHSLVHIPDHFYSCYKSFKSFK